MRSFAHNLVEGQLTHYNHHHLEQGRAVSVCVCVYLSVLFTLLFFVFSLTHSFPRLHRSKREANCMQLNIFFFCNRVRERRKEEKSRFANKQQHHKKVLLHNNGNPLIPPHLTHLAHGGGENRTWHLTQFSHFFSFFPLRPSWKRFMRKLVSSHLPTSHSLLLLLLCFRVW